MAKPAVGTVRHTEVVVLTVLFALLMLLRVRYDLHLRLDSGEPQHLHVAWVWTQGPVQYRNVFDNHMPLFHLLMAPRGCLMGPHADIAVLMRLTMLPLAAALMLDVVIWSPHRDRANWPLSGHVPWPKAITST